MSFRPKPVKSTTDSLETFELDTAFSTISSFTTDPPNRVSMFVNSFDSTESTNDIPDFIQNTVPGSDSSFELDFLDKVSDNNPSTTSESSNFFDSLSDLPAKINAKTAELPVKIDSTVSTPSETTQENVLTSQTPVFTTVFSGQVPMVFTSTQKTSINMFSNTQTPTISNTEKPTSPLLASILSTFPSTIVDFSTFAIPTYSTTSTRKKESTTQATRTTEDFYAQNVKLLQELLASQSRPEKIKATESTLKTTTIPQTTKTSTTPTSTLPTTISTTSTTTEPTTTQYSTTLKTSTTSTEPTTVRISKPKAVTTRINSIERTTKAPSRPQFSDADDLAFLVYFI